MSISTNPDNPLRKAAVLVASLDSDSADRILDQMTPDQAALVRSAVMDLDEIDPAEQRRVIAEFMGNSSTTLNSVGVEFEESLSRRFRGISSASDSTGDNDSGQSRSPFHFLHESPGELLEGVIEKEHPQTIAVIVSQLPPRRAAEVLDKLLPELQVEVLRRVADLDETPSEIIAEIEKQLEAVVHDRIHSRRRRAAGMAAVRSILTAAGDDHRRNMLRNLAKHDGVLATRVVDTDNTSPGQSSEISFRKHASSVAKPQNQSAQSGKANPPTEINPWLSGRFAALAANADLTAKLSGTSASSYTPNEMPASSPAISPAVIVPPLPVRSSAIAPADPANDLTFEELVHLDDCGLVSLLRAASPEMVTLALSGSNRSFMERINRRLGRKAAQELTRRIEQIGAVLLSDVEKAQHALAHLASQLIARGAIRPLNIKHFADAA